MEYIAKISAAETQEKRNNVILSLVEKAETLEDIRIMWEYVTLSGFPGANVYNAFIYALGKFYSA